MVDVLAVLITNPLFARAGRADLEHLAKKCDVMTLATGTCIFREGQPATTCYLLRSGLVGLIQQSGSTQNPRKCMVAAMGPGELFGDLSLFHGGPYTTSARVLSPSSLVQIPYPPLRSLLLAYPVLLWAFLDVYATRLYARNTALGEAVTLEILPRLSRKMLALAGDSDIVRLEASQEELASLVSASRERTNKALARLVRAGVITYSRHEYRIRDRGLLMQIAELS
jgi:CRP-like cAMP-binding protein